MSETPFDENDDIGNRSDVASRSRESTSRFRAGFEAATLVTSAECDEALTELLAEMTEIRRQLDVSYERFRSGGQRPDPAWVGAAKAAVGYRDVHRIEIQRRRAALAREERAAAHAKRMDERSAEPDDAHRRLRQLAELLRKRHPDIATTLWTEIEAKAKEGET